MHFVTGKITIFEKKYSLYYDILVTTVDCSVEGGLSLCDAGKQLLVMFCCLAHKKELVSEMHVRSHARPSCSYIFIMSEHMTRAWLDVCTYPRCRARKEPLHQKVLTDNNFPRYKKEDNNHLNDLVHVSSFLLHICSPYISYNSCKLPLWNDIGISVTNLSGFIFCGLFCVSMYYRTFRRLDSVPLFGWNILKWAQ
jgi:hypothetical protein